MERKTRKERMGLVCSTSMNKSIVVAVERRVKHPRYGKFVKATSSPHEIIPNPSSQAGGLPEGLNRYLSESIHLWTFFVSGCCGPCFLRWISFALSR